MPDVTLAQVGELQTACKERGMRAVGLTHGKLVTQLRQWIELSTNEKVGIYRQLVTSGDYVDSSRN